MINFTVGPVQMKKSIKAIGSKDLPYFRTSEFSELMKENEQLILKFVNAKKESKVVFLTGSGTSAMEASIINFIEKKKKTLVINGGSFGQRFVDILCFHNYKFTEIKLKYGENITKDKLNEYCNKGISYLLVNVHETSTGVLYNMKIISDFCKKNKIFLIVDAISSFLADEIDMSKLNIDVMLTSSQKALACSPGISIVIMSPRALKSINCYKNRYSYYFDIKMALNNQKRGQTPFTPAVGTLIQINKRLNDIDKKGISKEIENTKKLANYFRRKIKQYPLEIVSKSPSNALTALHPIHNNAYSIYEVLKDKYDIYVCPNGGDMKDYIFRVGHIGNISKRDVDILINALSDMNEGGLL